MPGESEEICDAYETEPSEGSSSNLKRHSESAFSSSSDESDYEESRSPRPRRKGSVVWAHFDTLENRVASCKYCHSCISYKSTITNLKTHLKRKHPKIYLGIDLKGELGASRAHKQRQDGSPKAECTANEQPAVTHELNPRRGKISQSFPPGRKVSVVWGHFDTLENNMASCKHCNNNFSYKATITNLKTHLKRKHPKICVGIDFKGELAEEQLQGRRPQTEILDVQIGNISQSSAPGRKGSVVWAHFDTLENSMACCKYCNNSFSYKATITNLKMHLKRKHPEIGVGMDVEGEFGASRAQEQLLDPQSLPPLSQPLVPPESKVTLPAHTFKSFGAHDKRVFIENVISKLFIWDFHPFTIVKDRGFRELLSAFVPSFVVPDEKYFSDSLMPSLFNICRANVRETIQAAKTSCLTTDLWTSVGNDTFLAVSAHYVSSDYVFKTVLLECVPLLGSPGSATVARELQRVAQEWDLKEKIQMVVTDGECNVKKAVESLGWRHFVCYAHTLNAVIEDSLKQVEQLLKRVRTIVAYFVTSPTATQTLEIVQIRSGISEPMYLIQDVPTRWMTTYYMLKRFSEIRESVGQAFSLLDADIAALYTPDLESCAGICEILSPFEEICTIMSQHPTFTASQVIPVSRGLKKTTKRLLCSDAYSKEACEVLKKLQVGLKEKIPNLEQDDIFAMCMFLDPRFKHYYESQEAAANTKQIVIALVTSIIAEKEERSAAAGASKKRDAVARKISIWEEFDEVTGDMVKPADALTTLASLEVEQYLREDALPRDKSPLDWWRFHEHLYPNLSHLVKLKFCASGTCVPSSVLFSEEGFVLLERRKRLNSSKIKELMFLNVNS